MRTNRLRSNAAAIIGYSERKGAGNALATARGFLARGWQPLPCRVVKRAPN